MAKPQSLAGVSRLAVLALVAAALPLGLWAAEDKVDWHKKALELNRITGEKPAEGKIKDLAGDAAAARQLLAAAAELVKDPNKQPLNNNATFILARVAEEVKDFDTSRTFYEIHIGQVEKLESPLKLATANWGLIKLLIDNKKFDDSQKVWQKYLEAPADDEDTPRFRRKIEQLMLIEMARKGFGDEALRRVEKKVKKSPKDWAALDLQGRVLREVGKLEDAVKVYQQIIDGVSKDEDLRAELKDIFIEECRYTLSAVFVDLDQIDKAAEQLKMLLDKDADNATYNNDLGFIWADHDKNLDESEKMIRKAIDQDRKLRLKELQKENPDARANEVKDNAAYIDSLGWVLFKQKKYKEARTYLQQAVDLDKDRSIEIYDHLADCLLALGERDEAVSTWKKGLEIAGTSPRDLKRKVVVEKKLKEQQK
jgi:tetratricopeptide (TPR) repeat protein